MKLLKNVLIRLAVGGRVDKVLYIDNLPEELLYEMQFPRKYVGKGIENHKEPDLTKDKVATLRLGLTDSPTGDKGIVFDLEREQGQTIWGKVEAYIKSMTPRGELPIAPVIYSQEPDKQSAPALDLDKIPKAVLSVLSPPTAGAVVAPVAVGAGASPIQSKADIIAEYKEQESVKRKEAMAKVRAAKKK